MDSLTSVLNGFTVVLSPSNLAFVFLGVLIGTVIGVLPGLGPSATIAVLLPVTYGMPPESAIIMLAGIYYGSMYGGTITSVLLQLPGEAASVVTVFDGYQMAKQGRAGPALGISAIGSFIGGTAAVFGLTMLAPLLSRLAISFGPPEYAIVAASGIGLACYLGTRSVTRSLISALVGLLIATVGEDPVTGAARYTFGSLELASGFDLIAIAMGLFGVGEILFLVARRSKATPLTSSVGRVVPTRDDLRRSRGPIARGSVIGFLIGILPGGGGFVSSLASYGVEKRLAKDPSRFGRGAIEGVAGPETANNASSSSAFIPLLTLGVPSNVVLALIYGALLLHGITPGPGLISEHPALFWGVIASMYVGNVMLLVLNLPLVGLFVQLLKVRIGILACLTIVVTCVGVFSVRNSFFDIWVMLAFGVIGYGIRILGFDPGPMVLAFVLGPILEGAVRQSLLLGAGSPLIFARSPLFVLVVGVVALLIALRIARRVSNKPGGRSDERDVAHQAAGEDGNG